MIRQQTNPLDQDGLDIMFRSNLHFCVRIFFIAVVALCLPWATLSSRAQTDASSEQESELLDLLRSEAAAAEKAIACKKLAIYGSDAAVPELAKLLPDPQLSSWARIPLEVIPGDAPDKALRTAAETLDGKLLVGVINSISFRRDAQAVDLLITKLEDADLEVASAAAVALGNIGDASAIQALQHSLSHASDNLRSPLAEGCVLAAERLHQSGDANAAADLYDLVRTSKVPQQRLIEATRGAILARNQDGIPLLFEAFRSTDKEMFQLALSTVREFPGSQVDQELAAELKRTTPERAALIVQAMADRPETVSLPDVLQAAETGDKRVRLSAMEALQRIGDNSCLATLLKIATDKDADLASAAQESIAVLPGERVDQEIRQALSISKDSQRIVLLKLIGERRIDAVDDVIQSLGSPAPSERHAAFFALGETVALPKLSVLIAQAVRPSYPDDAAVAQQALQTACVRMPDREACAAELAAALKKAPATAKTMLLETVAAVGGQTALDTLATAANSADSQLQDDGSRLLGTWNNLAAAPVLLELAKSAPEEKYRVRALRGYLGLARKFSMPDQQRAEMCQNAFDLTRRTSERKLALEVLKIHPSAAGLEMAVQAMKLPELKTDATTAVVTISQGLKGVDLQQLLLDAGLEKVQLEIVKAEYGAGSQLRDVTNVLRQQNVGLPLIALSGPYNASFGGDPAPGVAKQLRIRYRINGKNAEASFAENSPILLPTPE
ncbi:MAG: HEAT repeat domain-containing protein [Planctomycetales bacterium]|nr:HEAT repeat domain-containing protein [Planctomycetales bacterium]